ncbi:MAG: polysaccharide deacetylase family protein [Actinomycetota bacterium]|nr:polysaccharide deacetylase family protein [Actinomycetota bacterium]
MSGAARIRWGHTLTGMRRRTFLAAAASAVLSGCSRSAGPSAVGTASSAPTPAGRPSATAPASPPPTPSSAKEILSRSTVPVLCYHQLRDFRADDSDYARTIITPPPVFTAQLQALRDGDYTPITADALVDHLQFGTGLPDRPVLLTFDDGSVTHHSVALPALTQYGFPGTFFPMTVVLNKPNWLSEDQLRELDQASMTIGTHSWDHQRMDRLTADQWETQVDEPKAQLAAILGHPVDLMAYPYGAWSQQALSRAGAAGYRAAFQLSDVQDPAQPLLAIRRIMPPPTWDAEELRSHLESEF